MDGVLAYFREAQALLARQLAAESDLLDVDVLDPAHIVARYRCRGLVRAGSGAIEVADDFVAGFYFGSDYLRGQHPMSVVTWLAPHHVWHANVRAPAVCVGPIEPGTPVDELIFRVWDLITWNNATIVEREALNPDACVWARHHPEALPVDARPLKWRIPPGAAATSEGA